MRRFSSQSDEYVKIPIWAREDGQNVDVTEDTTVKVGFFAPDDWDPDVGSMVLGEWEVDAEKGITYARRRMGGLQRGKYRMWAKPEGAGVAPESPLLFSETLFEVV